MTVRLVLISTLLFAGCTTQVFTPPARPMPLSPAQVPARGNWDAQLDGTMSGVPVGPTIAAGNLRYRRGITDQVAVVGDVGFARAQGDEAPGLNPNAGTARVGAQVSTDLTDDLDAAAFGGLGGGYAPEAGGWGSIDVGGMVTGNNRLVRPILLADVYGSQPFATKVFSVSDTMLRLPRTVGVIALAGFDLGHRDRAVLLGLATGILFASANDTQEAIHETFVGLGGGFRFGN